MKRSSSRRDFLAAGLAAPASALAAKSAGTPAVVQALKPTVKVRYRTLGKTGLKVSTLGFGCMITSDPSVIERAADLGINFFDTARVYQGGNNERMVGAALKSRRSKVYLCTKTPARSREGALQDLETSLKSLGTDYIDVWYLHDKRSASQIAPELIEAQQIAKKQGKIRFAGLSLHTNHGEVIPAAIKTGQFDVLLATYNFAMDKKVEALVESAQKAGLGIVVMKVMAGSFRLDNSYDRAKGILKREGAAPAALKWVLRNPNVHTAIPSITDMDQLDENFQAMSAPYTDADEKVLAAQLERIRPLYCRMCARCEGACPEGLPVADILRYLTYAEGYGQFALGREHFLALPAEARQVRCGLCPQCKVECPFGVRVAERLSRAQELFA